MGNLGFCDGISGQGISVRFQKQIFQINSDLNVPMYQIKAKISVRNQLSIRSIVLTYNGAVLQEMQTLQQIGFNHQTDNLILSISEDAQTQFTMTIRNINFSDGMMAKSTEKVKQVKKKIDRKHSVQASLQRLIFNGQVLEDDQEIGKYGIHEGSVVHLAIILK